MVRRALLRLPFSRFQPLLWTVLRGTEDVHWRGVTLRVEVGEYEGFFKYFDPHGPDPELEWLLREGAASRVFFDVGANQGHVSLALARACPELRVVAFEPDPSAGAALAGNLALNPEPARRIQVERVAAGAASGTAQFEPAGGLNSGVGRLSESGGVTVAVATLESCADRLGLTPDLIKIDVEGAEADVLDGLGRVGSHLRALAMEVHSLQPSAAEREAFATRLTAGLKGLPLRYRYLLDERDWVDQPPERPWPARMHAFGRRP